MNEIAKVENMSIAEIKSNVQVVQNVLKNVMLKGCHYDKIKGCGDKPVLLKPGAEKILATFMIGTEIKTEDLGDGYDHRYRITCRGFHIPTGNTIGYGVGEASTAEKKYAWREAVCQEEFDEIIESRRQEYWKKGYKNNSPQKILQVRQNPADLANTVLKMAKKRAMIDLCLTATACSDIFEQDLDEEHIRENVKPEAKQYQQPQAKPEENDETVISEAQARRLYAIAQNSQYEPGQIKTALEHKYGVPGGSSRALPWRLYERICQDIEQGKLDA
ncbi:MAG: hypothetical protein GY742_18405 [Hyphomicrobiales bacterium]|nr:hypothetical protein [Hyphomicrobiales bacterium]